MKFAIRTIHNKNLITNLSSIIKNTLYPKFYFCSLEKSTEGELNNKIKDHNMNEINKVNSIEETYSNPNTTRETSLTNDSPKTSNMIQRSFKENFLAFSYRNNINYKHDLQDKASHFFRSSQVKLIHYLDDKNINDYKKGIIENDYELYEIYKEVPEILFLGRSNVGKSSLINSLFDRQLTTPHKSPGKTQKLEFYLIGTPKKKGTRASIYSKFLKMDQKNLMRNVHPRGIFLDAPGFGYVAGPVELRRKFKYLIYTYLNYAVRLKQIIYLVNGEYGMTDIDRDELEFLNKFNKEIQLVFTKVDDKNKNNLIQYVSDASHFTRKLKNVRNEILLTSTRTKYGIHNLRTHLFLDMEEFNGDKFDIGKKKIIENKIEENLEIIDNQKDDENENENELDHINEEKQKSNE